MKKILVVMLFACLFFNSCVDSYEVKNECVQKNNLVYHSLPKTWKHALPLGNGLLGAQVWQFRDSLRINLDCAYLWDLRPMKGIDQVNFARVKEQVAKHDYGIIQQTADAPYTTETAPCKILGATIIFDNIDNFGKVTDYTLDLPTGSSRVRWASGTQLRVFVHATEPVGWFKFDGVPSDFEPLLEAPVYNGSTSAEGNVIQAGSVKSARTLGYEQGKVKKAGNTLVYEQQGWGGFSYQVALSWERKGKSLVGAWSISTVFPKDNVFYDDNAPVASDMVADAMESGYKTYLKSHKQWWQHFWEKSSICLPEDSVVEQEWYLSTYKFGAMARQGAPAVSLNSVWSNDDGLLPAWKGDYHNDENSQKAFEACYMGNHLEGSWAYFDWLWELRPTFREYTRTYFGVEGLNAPGCCTVDGKPMGGWVQYSCGPTVSSWFALHFYQYWRYSMNRDFLEQRAYPWFKEVIQYLDNITEFDENGLRKLPLSSSPEFNGNGINAWYPRTSNFDLALIRFTYQKGAELAGELGYADEQQQWSQIATEWPYYDVDSLGGLTVAPGVLMDRNHRHHSHMHAIYPISEINMGNGEMDEHIIKASLRNIKKHGVTLWPFHTANYYARAWDGEGALETLYEHFNRPSSVYHDVDGKKHAILKGPNWGCQAIQEMLLQCHCGFIHVFPAVPDKWQNCSFENLRADGAFLVSATRKEGKTVKVTVFAEKGGLLRIKNPYGPEVHHKSAKENADNSIWEFKCRPNEILKL